MLIYIILITYIFLISILMSQIESNTTRRKNSIIFLGLLGIFAVLSLKKDTVGIDISGYKDQYYIIKNMNWFDYDYVYFEKGYMFLTQLFSKLGASFQLFTIVLYGFFCYTLFIYFKSKSAYPTLSLIIFICYQFFVFSISGLRQTIALSFIIWAIYIIELKSKNSYYKFILSILFVMLAYTFHKSAIIGLLIPFISILSNKRIHISYYIIAGLMVILLRNLFLENIILYFFERDYTGSDITLGGNFVFLLIVAVLMFFINQRFTKNSKGSIVFYTRISLITVILYLLLSGSTLLRGLMFFQIFILISIPLSITYFNNREKSLILIFLYCFFILLFYFETLSINQFELMPYLFFWE